MKSEMAGTVSYTDSSSCPSSVTASVNRVARIVATVRGSGDEALLRYAQRFDQLAQPVEVSHQEMQAGLRSITPDLRAALRTSATHIRRIAKRQLPRNWRATITPGVEIEQRVTPLHRVGCYVPAGRYPLPSSLLMTAVPATVAGVPEVIVVCPHPDPTILAAAALPVRHGSSASGVRMPLLPLPTAQLPSRRLIRLSAPATHMSPQPRH